MPSGYPNNKYEKVAIQLVDDMGAAEIFERPKMIPVRTGPTMKQVVSEQISGMQVGQVRSQTFERKVDAQRVQTVVHGINASTRRKGGHYIYACAKDKLADGTVKLAIKRIR